MLFVAKKRYKTQTNPLTGRKEKVLKSGYHRDPFSGKIRKSRSSSFNNSYSKRKPRKLSAKEERQKNITVLLVICLAALIYFFTWVASHPLEGSLIIVAVVLISYLVFRKKIKSFFSSITSFFIKEEVKDEAVSRIIDAIKSMNVQTSRDEREFETQVFQRLDALGFRTERQVPLGSRKVIDLVVDGKIGIELKVADRIKNVQDLIGQATIYKKHISKLVVVILDVGITGDISEYTSAIADVDPENIYVLTLFGNVKRKKKKVEYILVKKTTS